MNITADPWLHPDPDHSPIRLTRLPVPLFDALAAGLVEPTIERAELLTPYLLGPESTSLWTMRSTQLAARPEDAAWVTRLVLIPDSARAVGLAGFHGGPDHNGMVELGYRIDPLHRRKGYARAALETLIDVARAQPEVRVIRATVAPDNLASRALIDGYGFAEVGEQWDDEDGLEIILELPARP